MLIDGETVKYNPFENLRISRMSSPSNFTKIRDIIFQQKKSFQKRILYDKKIYKLIRDFISKNKYKFVIFDNIRTGQYMQNIPVELRKSSKFILYMDYLFHLRYERLLKVIKEYNININELSLFENFEKSLKNIPLFKYIKKNQELQLILLKKRFVEQAKSKRENERLRILILGIK